MKGWIKGMLIAAAVFVATGTAVCGVAWAMGGRFSYYRHKRFGFMVEDKVETELQNEAVVWEEAAIPSDGYYDGKEHHEATYIEGEVLAQEERAFDGWLTIDGKQIRELEIQVAGAHVEMMPDETVDEVTVEIGNDNYRCDQIVDDDTLKISVRRRKNTGGILPDFDEHGDAGVEIRIPAGCEFQDVELEVKGGVLYAYGIAADILELDLEAGSLEVAGSSAGELNGDCKAGELIYNGNVERKMEADCSAGAIEYELAGREEDFNYELEKQMGSILINGTERGQFNKKTIASNPGAIKEAGLECKVGEIQVNFSE